MHPHPTFGTEDKSDEYVLQTLAIMAARKAAEFGMPTQDPKDPWWDEGPHVEKDGRSYYVHAMGCMQSQLGHALQEHPDWYFVAAFVRGREVELHGLDDPFITLGEVAAMGQDLHLDDKRLAAELTSREKRRAWGVEPPRS